MAGSVNKCVLLGYLGKDPEIRSFNNGGRVANFSLATTESWKDEDGKKQERVQWHQVAVFNDGLVGVVEQYLRKGSRVYLEGQLENRSWDDNGTKRYATEVVLRPFRGELTLLDKPEPTREPERPAPRQSRGNAPRNERR